MKAKKGQTVLEFALVSALFIFALVITLNGILAFVAQQYLSYAAFMAARAYQAASASPGEQVAQATQTLQSYLPNLTLPAAGGSTPVDYALRFPLFKRPVAFIRQVAVPPASSGDYGPGATSDLDGQKNITIDFVVPLAQLPLGDVIRAQLGSLPLQAKSYLGREVSRAECRRFFQGFLQSFRLQGGVPSDVQQLNESFSNRNWPYMEDNGC